MAYIPLHAREIEKFHLQQWLQWYNYHKIHLGLGMNRRTPAEVVFQGLLEKASCVNLMLQPNNF
ncbi:hypothetical protein A3D11_00430 [Candidatus Peribacteria bacterium RIFCSPHIGHO2_02_FULL_49_16]|nr:MAG: hypothetical protein A3D11_00430 [Candidatus Peribacteria bacterium RIFCSPHIGHO2_02_FULL_49_16]